ncbi:MAG: type 2 isopentenyl-diphosphate Delta-isomerase [Deltaproteobacteria bacterium]|nr:type 2 isopentenyl-diphosphate Delta-isomerase [Deltaproteobacteria bacterium]
MNPTARRKNSHLEVVLKRNVEFPLGDALGFANLRFEHDALPELDRAKIDTGVTLLGKKLDAPMIVGAMTGGTKRAKEINRRLALAAETCGIGFALGSQRPMLEDRAAADSYHVRKHAPKLRLLFGNAGAVQLNYGVSAKDLARLARDTVCDAFNFHLNPLQEAVQTEGNTDFSALLAKLAEVIPALGVPVLAKEVGAGISATTAAKLARLPLAGVETAGLGGTSWSYIEGLRAKDPFRKALGEAFARWGISTPESIVACRNAFGSRVVVASGGIRGGIDAAKALALGADAFAMALPILKAAEQSAEAAIQAIRQVIEELRTAMFLTGSRNVAELKTRALKRLP